MTSSDTSSIDILGLDSTGVSDSHFYMWRTLFAIAHVDDIVTDEETRFMAEAFEEIDFSEAQREILDKDVLEAQDIEEMFSKITEQEDRLKFFEIARKLVHIDGEYGGEEQEIMLRLTQKNVEKTDIDELVGKVDLELEDDE